MDKDNATQIVTALGAVTAVIGQRRPAGNRASRQGRRAPVT